MIEEKGMAAVGAHRLAYSQMGSGSPVVVLEAALGAPGEIWENIMPEIARFTRVIRYDRAGLGESEQAGPRRTLAELTDDLKGLLEALQIPGPYLLVGLSFGGYIVRCFAHQHPELVAGLVLIESSHPDSGRRMLEVMPAPTPEDSDFLKEMYYRLTHEDVEDVEGEDDGMESIDFRACDDQAREASSLGDLPLVVIAGANHAKDEGDPIHDPALVPPTLAAAIEQNHLKVQAELAQLSTRGRFVIARESGHFVHWHEPELVVGIIKALAAAYRAGQ